MAVSAPLKGMVELPGGTFRMGSADFYPEERPVRDVPVEGFWIDRHPVTVADDRHIDQPHRLSLRRSAECGVTERLTTHG